MQLRSASDLSAEDRARLHPDYLKRLGHCYENAGRRVTSWDEPDAVLVHGTIQGLGYPPNPHAWVAFSDGQIWDPTLDQTFPADLYERFFNARWEARYTPEETAVASLRHGHWGPWHENG